MKIIDALRINSKKLKYRTSKALFLIVPITALVALSIIISSQVNNFQVATDKSVFGEIEEESTVIELVYQNEDDQGRPRFLQGDNQFTEADLSTIQSIENVTDAAINYTIPISNIESSDLFEDKTVSFREISALNSTMAGLYTDQDFTYVEGQPIPIILSSSTFIETYEDWNGKKKIKVDFRAAREAGQDLNQSNPVKFRAIDYSKEELIGQEFTISFGGLSDIATYEVEREDGVAVFKKLTKSEIKKLNNERRDLVNDYWNYKKISQGHAYTFKVVGVIESDSSRVTYVPEAFANQAMKDYIELQINSRNSKDLDDDLLSTTYTGLSYDGTEITQSSGMGRGGMMMPGGMGPGGEANEETESYEIPGLVIKVDEEDGSEIIGTVKNSNIFEKSVKTGDTITLKINSIYDRAQVVDDLNDSGYAYQDTEKLEVFETIQTTLNQISVGVVIAFIVLTVAVIILTTSKFVSDSTKEIGIFRAVGFTKGNILTIFLSQSLLYTTVAYLLGVGFGLAGNYLASSFIANWFDQLVSATIRESFNVVNAVDYSVFKGIDYSSLAILSGILLVVTAVISFIPAIKASNVSPVEAIKE